MDADLVLAAGQQVDLEQAQVTGLAQNAVGGTGELALCGIGGRVDVVGAVFGQEGGDSPFLGGQPAVDDGEVALFGLLPVPLQKMLRLLAFGEDEEAGSFPVEAMDDEYPVV